MTGRFAERKDPIPSTAEPKASPIVLVTDLATLEAFTGRSGISGGLIVTGRVSLLRPGILDRGPWPVLLEMFSGACSLGFSGMVSLGAWSTGWPAAEVIENKSRRMLVATA